MPTGSPVHDLGGRRGGGLPGRGGLKGGNFSPISKTDEGVRSEEVEEERISWVAKRAEEKATGSSTTQERRRRR